MNIADDAGSQRPGGEAPHPDQPADRGDDRPRSPRRRPSHTSPAVAGRQREAGSSSAPALTLRGLLARPARAAWRAGATNAQRSGDDTDQIRARPQQATGDASGDVASDLDDTDETPIPPDDGDDTDELAVPAASSATDDEPAHADDSATADDQPAHTDDDAEEQAAGGAADDEPVEPPAPDAGPEADADAQSEGDGRDDTGPQPAEREDADEDAPTAGADQATTADAAEAEAGEAEAGPGADDAAQAAAAAPTEVEPAAPADDEPAGVDADDLGEAPRSPWERIGSAVLLAAAAVVGSLPVLWVLGAVWWRQPTLLVENMFTGFSRCALQYGALTPLEMVCPRAGIPLGMYQLDGGLSYPLGGALQQAGLDPLAAWKWSAAVLIVAGTGALFWVLWRLTGSPLLAICFLGAYGLGGALTGRSWNWYWNITAAALLPIVFAAVYVLYRRAPERRLVRMVVPGLWLVLGVLAVSLEWQYAGLFATATAAGAALLLTLQLGWRWWQRPVLLLGIAGGLGAVVTILRWRLTVAGIEEQFRETVVTAGRHSIDIATFLVPDEPMTYIGRVLGANGWHERLVRSMVDGNQLWVAPYLGVLVAAFLLVVWLVRRLRLRRSPGRPRGFLLFLLLVAVACVALGLGPIVRLAPLTQPSSVWGSPVAALYPSTPLQWIRYPWTWGYLLHVTLVLLYAALAVALLRRGPRRWSLLVVPLVLLLALDFVSPQVLRARTSTQPSIALAPDWTRIDSDDPAAVRFTTQQLPELHEALERFEEPVVIYPWGNAWITPRLGPQAGVPVRNVGIDRNVRQVVAASPYGYGQLKRPEPEELQDMLDSGWASALVLLDHMPTGDSILRFDHTHRQSRDTRRLLWNRNRTQEFFEAGYCVTDHSWFRVVTTCDGDAPATERALASPRP